MQGNTTLLPHAITWFQPNNLGDDIIDFYQKNKIPQ